MRGVRFVKGGVARAIRTLRAAANPAPAARVVPARAEDGGAADLRRAGRRRRAARPRRRRPGRRVAHRDGCAAGEGRPPVADGVRHRRDAGRPRPRAAPRRPRRRAGLTRRCANRSATVPWSRRTRRAGASVPTATGSGCSPPRKQPSTRFAAAAGSTMRSLSSPRTSPAEKRAAQKALYGNRRRIRGDRGRRLLRRRGELVERPFAHQYETGGCGGCGCAATGMCASGCSSRRPVATSDSCCAA